VCEGEVKIGVFPFPFFLSSCAYLEARTATASITIGEGTWINNNLSVIAEHSQISIGSNCLIGLSVEVIDSDFHGLKVTERGLSDPERRARPVSIGNDVFIGSHVKIMKGVTVGDGAVIASGSLVTKDVPPRVVAAGNPARVIREIE
jgi:maltose O-acetyltransferase